MDVRTILIEDLVPSRNIRADVEVSELRDSIREHGLLQPIRVRPVENGKYQVIAGHRRVAAARALGFREIPAVVADESDRGVAVQNVVENLQRENLSPLELARGIRELQAGFGLDADAIAKALSKSPHRIRTYLRAARLPDDVLARLETG
jgi:ParB family transcriptional regulator, chromosome partitioning protein